MSSGSRKPNRFLRSIFLRLSSRQQNSVRRLLLRVGIRKRIPFERFGYVHQSAIVEDEQLIAIDPTADIAEYCIIRSFVNPVKIGARTHIGPFTVIYGGAGVEIGSDVLISPHVVIVAGNHDYVQLEKPMRWAGGLSNGPIRIEDDVWVGAHCTICDGVTIARGCVIGAGATVTKSTAPYGIYGGVPARLIGSRRPDCGVDDAQAEAGAGAQ